MNASNLIVLILSAIFMWSCAYGSVIDRDPKTGERIHAARTIALMSGSVATHESVDGKTDVILNKENNLGPVLRDLAEVVKQGGMAYTGTSAAGNAMSPGPSGFPPHSHPEIEEMLLLLRAMEKREP